MVGPVQLPDRPVPRRTLLALAAAGPAVLAGLAACTAQAHQPTGPDELEPLVDRARADAALATATAAVHADLTGRLTPVAEARAAHAQALVAEVLRARPDRAAAVTAGRPAAAGPPTSGAAAPGAFPGGTPTGAPPGVGPATLAAVLVALTAAAEQAAAAAVSVPRYRAGLIGSVAAACAGQVAMLR